MTNVILTQIPLEELKAAISEAVKMEVEKINLHPTKQETEYITRKDAASILGISLPTLNTWSKCGILQSYKIGSQVRYKKEEVLTSLSKVHSIKYSRGS